MQGWHLTAMKGSSLPAPEVYERISLSLQLKHHVFDNRRTRLMERKDKGEMGGIFSRPFSWFAISPTIYTAPKSGFPKTDAETAGETRGAGGSAGTCRGDCREEYRLSASQSKASPPSSLRSSLRSSSPSTPPSTLSFPGTFCSSVDGRGNGKSRERQRMLD